MTGRNITIDYVLTLPITGEFNFPLKESQILLELVHKKNNSSIYAGFSDKLERYETPEQAAVRVLGNQLSITVDKEYMHKCAELTFHKRTPGKKFHVYFVNKWEGVPVGKNISQWFDLNTLPSNLTRTDKLWLSRAFTGEKVIETFNYDVNSNMLPNMLTSYNSSNSNHYF